MVLEDVLDAISHKMLNPKLNVNYIATIGAPSIKVIEYLASKFKAGEKFILGGDNDLDGQHFNMRIAANMLQEYTGDKFNAAKGNEKYIITVDAGSIAAIDLHYHAFDGIEVYNKDGQTLNVEIDAQRVTASFDKDPDLLYQALNNLLRYYGANTVEVERPELKDFNDVLKRLVQEDKKNQMGRGYSL